MKWFAWWRRRRLDDLSEEIQSHLEEKTDALIANGLPRADAEREARRAFGNVTRVKESAGDVSTHDVCRRDDCRRREGDHPGAHRR